MTGSLLSVDNLQLAFGGVKAVDGLTFNVEAEEIVSVIGPNGAGKTSAFNCITGFYQPTGGNVFVDGEKVTRLRPAKVAKKGVSRTFQNLRLFGDLTVLDNVRAGMHLRVRQSALDALLHTPRYRRGEEQFTREAHEWLDFVGLNTMRGIPAKNLSYGDQRRVEMARALARQPRLLLLDEPGAGLNHGEKNEMLELIRRIRELGIGLVLIEHDMGVVMKVSDRIVVMNFGKEIAEGTPAEVKSNPEVIEAYLGSETDPEDISDERAKELLADEGGDHVSS